MVNDMLILARFRGVLASWQVLHLDAENSLAASGHSAPAASRISGQ